VGVDSEGPAEPVIAEPVIAEPVITEPVITEPPMRPNKLARILATVIVSSATAAIITKLLGRRAGFVALLVTASAHEVLEAPLADLIGTRLRLMTA
jgi:hypothetical protein